MTTSKFTFISGSGNALFKHIDYNQESLDIEQQESLDIEQQESLDIEQQESLDIEQQESLDIEQQERHSVPMQGHPFSMYTPNRREVGQNNAYARY